MVRGGNRVKRDRKVLNALHRFDSRLNFYLFYFSISVGDNLTEQKFEAKKSSSF